MQKQELLRLVVEYGSIRTIAAAHNCSPSTIQYWLKKHGIKTGPPPEKEQNRCGCGETDPSKFYRSKSKRNGYCKKCQSRYYIERWREKKKRAVIYKGGACEHCGLKTEHYSVYDFHHLEPITKKLSRTKLKSATWKKMVIELDKCILLCANCHRIVHECDLTQPRHVFKQCTTGAKVSPARSGRCQTNFESS